MLLETHIQISAIEEQNGYHATADTSIGKIEYRAEEYEVLTSDKRHPGRPVEAEERKVEHIYHLTMQKLSVSFAEWYQFCNSAVAVRKYFAIYHRVDEVAYCTCKHKCHADHIADGEFQVFYYLEQIIAYEYHCHHPEACQEYLVEQFHSECHTLVLDKIDVEPIKDADALVFEHRELYRELNYLVCHYCHKKYCCRQKSTFL